MDLRDRGDRAATAWIVAVVRAVAVVCAVAFIVGQSAAHADQGVTSGATQTLGGCLDAGDVWLHLQTDDDRVLRSECVGKPVTGIDALETADVAMTYSTGAYLCTLAGVPEHCPKTFNGHYWQYWHATSAGADWQYSAKGPGDFSPAPGSIEGWCYNTDAERRCELPTLNAQHRASPRIDDVTASGGASPWLVLLLVAVTAVVFVWVRQRRGPGDLWVGRTRSKRDKWPPTTATS